MKEFAINEALANEILQYLSKQPYTEVVGMINRLAQLKEIFIKGKEDGPVAPVVPIKSN
jgi:hypothetical protein